MGGSRQCSECSRCWTSTVLCHRARLTRPCLHSTAMQLMATTTTKFMASSLLRQSCLRTTLPEWPADGARNRGGRTKPLMTAADISSLHHGKSIELACIHVHV